MLSSSLSRKNFNSILSWLAVLLPCPELNSVCASVSVVVADSADTF